MKKMLRGFALLICVTTVAAMLPATALAAENYAAAYANELNYLVNTYGVMTKPEQEKGVARAELMDFDANGVPEMYVLYRNGDVFDSLFNERIYAFVDGKASIVYDQGCGDKYGWSKMRIIDRGDIKYVQQFTENWEAHEDFVPMYYHTVGTVKQFDGRQFVDIYVEDHLLIYAGSKEELLNMGYVPEAGYEINYSPAGVTSYYPSTGKYARYYYVDHYTVSENGGSVTYNNIEYDVYNCGFLSKNPLIESLNLDFYKVSYADSYGIYLEKKQFNTKETQRHLSELSDMLAGSTAAPGDIIVTLNGAAVNSDTAPIARNGHTLVPLRSVLEQMGADVSWDADSNTAICELNGNTVKITIGENQFSFNGKQRALDAPAEAVDGRTMVPLRAIVEALGGKVGWDGVSRIVSVEI